MTGIVLTVTTAGRAALISAAHDGTALTRIAAVGITQSAFVPVVGLTAVPGEFARLATVSGLVAAADTIHLTVSDDGAGTYSLHGFGLYLADGTLFATYGQSSVIAEKSPASTLLLALDVRFADIDAAALTFGDTSFVNPPATTEVVGVVELATSAEAIDAVDSARAVTPSALKAVLDGRFGAGSATAFVRSLLVAANAAAFRLILGIKSAALKDEGSGNGLDADKLDGYHAFGGGGAGAAWPYIPVVGGDGVMEIGRFIDFHATSADAGDFTARLQVLGTNALGISGQQIWTSGNDGAGSGLDADLLDGQDSGYYTDVAGRLGYIPAARDNAQLYGTVRLTSNSYSNRPGIILDNRGSNGPDNTPYRVGGYYFAGYRDVANPALIAGIWCDRSTAAGGLASQGSLVFGTSLSGSSDANDLSERMRITSIGFVGIGTTTPNAPLQVSRDSNSNPGAYNVIGRLTNAAYTIGVDIAVTPGGLPYLSSTFGGELALQPAGGRVSINGNTAWHLGNDGAGSGMDADMLDGLHATSFLRGDVAGFWQLASTGTADLGFNSASIVLREANFGNAAALGPRIGFHWAGRIASQLALGLDGSLRVLNNPGTGYETLRAGSLYSFDQIVWNAGNDGAGSGLDADLLDGRDSSDFASAGHSHTAPSLVPAFPNSLADDGFQQLPNGMIMQWGKVRRFFNGEQNAGFFAFPVEFPGRCLNISLTPYNSAGSNNRDLVPQVAGDPVTTGFNVYLQSWQSNSQLLDGFNWFAIGF